MAKEIFDSTNFSNEQRGRKPAGRKRNEELVITINPTSNRIYFTSKLAEDYGLIENGVRFQVEAGEWALLTDKTDNGIEVIHWKGGFYIYSNVIVARLGHLSSDGVTSFKMKAEQVDKNVLKLSLKKP